MDGPVVEEHLGQLEPGVDVVGVGGHDRPVEPLRLGRGPAPVREPRLEQRPVVIGQRIDVAHGLVGGLLGQVRAQAPLGGDAQAVPGQGELLVLVHGRSRRLRRFLLVLLGLNDDLGPNLRRRGHESIGSQLWDNK